jgi:hypothetical protein
VILIIDTISMQSPDAVMALTGDCNSLNTDTFVNDCSLVMLKDSATHGKRFLDKFFTSQSVYTSVKQCFIH